MPSRYSTFGSMSLRRSLRIAIVLLSLLGAASCGSTYASRGGMIGGAIGAGTGAIIGAQSGAAGPGAIIGAGVGLISGALIGGGLDEVEAKSRARDAHHGHETVVYTTPAPPPPTECEPPLTHDDVIRLAQSGVSDYVIIAKIRASRTVFRMTVDDVLVLREAGVGNDVIDEMIRYRPKPRPVRREVITTRRHAHTRYCGCVWW